MRRPLLLVVVMALIVLPRTSAQTRVPGSRCEPGAPAGNGLNCQATDEWDVVDSSLLNASKGDILLTFGSCDFLIGQLLRAVSPPQFYTHAGMVTVSHSEIRHSTAVDQRIIGSCGSDGCSEDRLRFIWPGAITQSVHDAFEGSTFVEPDGRTDRLIGPFRTDSLECDGETTAPLVLKPSLERERAVRPRLEAAADRLLAMNGHYRFFAYTRGAISRDGTYTPRRGWPDGYAATMCSSFLWTALRDAGVTLEGTDVEAGDLRERDPDTDGLYLYSPDERLEAGRVLYDALWNLVYDEEIDWQVTSADAADDVANQIANCFGSDACDVDAKDSADWRDDPGDGRTVSPDDMRQWDPYDDEQEPHYQPRRYVRVFTWQPIRGTGTLEGTVTWAGAPMEGATVSMPELDLATLTDRSGRFRFVQVAGGPRLVRASMEILERTASAEELVVVQAGQTATTQLGIDFNALPEHPVDSRFQRLVAVSGTMRIVDHEDIFANEVCHVGAEDLRRTFRLDVVNRPTDEYVFQSCCGDEVVGTFRMRLRLAPAWRDHSVDRIPLHVSVSAELHESDDCDADEREDSERRSFDVAEDRDGSAVIHLRSGPNRVDIDLTVSNARRPPP